MLIIALLVSRLAYAWDFRPNLSIAECADELPYGVPASQVKDGVLLCREGYALQHDNSARIAAWTAWSLLPSETIGCNPRADAFSADKDVPVTGRATPDDYARSGYDRGHMAPDADMSWSKQTSIESFLMSNMSPQLPNLNRGVWKLLEAQTRAWAWSRKHTLALYSGNIYTSSVKRIGSGVVVPDALYKIVIDTVTSDVLAFRFSNIDKQPTDMRLFLTSVSEIEKQSGITFPMPADYDKTKVATDVWPGGQGEVIEAKKAACKAK